MRAWDDVLSERRRQICEEGWTPEHDDAHDGGELAHAAGCYALFSGSNADADDPPKYWPWDDGWTPSEYRRDLVKAAALLVAEIERIDRAEKQRAALDALVTKEQSND